MRALIGLIALAISAMVYIDAVALTQEAPNNLGEDNGAHKKEDSNSDVDEALDKALARSLDNKTVAQDGLSASPNVAQAESVDTADTLGNTITDSASLFTPELEKRARSIEAQLRCLVCQKPEFEHSDDPLAKEVRAFVQTRLVLGDNDKQILALIEENYVDKVLVHKAFEPSSLLVWGFPLITLIVGSFFAFHYIRPIISESSPSAKSVIEIDSDKQPSKD